MVEHVPTSKIEQNPTKKIEQSMLSRSMVEIREVATKFRLGGQPVVTMTSQF